MLSPASKGPTRPQPAFPPSSPQVPTKQLETCPSPKQTPQFSSLVPCRCPSFCKNPSITAFYITSSFKAGVPNPRATDRYRLWPVRNRAAQQEVSVGQVREASSVFTATPHCSHYHLSSASCQHYGGLYNYFIMYYSVIILEIRCTINAMRLNHPETIPPTPVEKLSSTKLVPGAKKVGDRCFKVHLKRHIF